MKFGWINLIGAAIMILMLIPNIIYALRNRDEINLCSNTFMNALEQIEFGFTSIPGAILYLAGNALLLAAYWLLFARYMKKKDAKLALMLAILPTCIFLLSGLTLRHWLLAAFAVLFGIGHIYVTYKNAV